MRLIPGLLSIALGACLHAVGAGAQGAPGSALGSEPTLDQLISAQDSRSGAPAELAILRAGAAARDPMLRAFSVRALGRQERPGLLDALASPLADPVVEVRLAAASAVAQAVSRGEGVDGARRMLQERLPAEGDARVRGRLAEALGRLPADSAAVAPTARAIARELPERGAVRGLFFLTRQRIARDRVPAEVGEALQRAVTSPELSAEVRALAATARVAAGGATPTELDELRRDPLGSVRAVVATAESINDPEPVVRYRAVALAGCRALVTATADPDSYVALAAVDALPRCTGDPAAPAAIAALERSPSPRAVVALAVLAPERTIEQLSGMGADPDPFVRVHAARAAARLRDTSLLRALAGDPDANVASAAIEGLAPITGHADDPIYIAALRSDASQLLMAAAAALGYGRDSRLAPAAARAPLLSALDRVTALGRETSRDARMALVEALGGAVPERYASDFDPAIAERAAQLTGLPATPRPLPATPPPTGAQLRAIQGATIRMADGGVIELELFPLDAPTNVWRFVRLAREGYFDGLTFHRIAPFFVVQGGSPLANEYVGDGQFTRDEVGLENRRGTVGISTRGRDTGDGQIFINTVDNFRLDHDYTVFARVVSGMDVVDRMREGARMESVVVR